MDKRDDILSLWEWAADLSEDGTVERENDGENRPAVERSAQEDDYENRPEAEGFVWKFDFEDRGGAERPAQEYGYESLDGAERPAQDYGYADRNGAERFVQEYGYADRNGAERCVQEYGYADRNGAERPAQDYGYEDLDGDERFVQEYGYEDRPTAGQFEAELRRLRLRQSIIKSARNSLGALLVVAAVVTLIFTHWLPVLQVQRGSMTPTLRDGDVVIFFTGAAIKHGDIIAFQHGNQVLIKRVIAISGDFVDIDDDGMVILNGEPLDEPYVSALSAGERGTELPCQVSDDQYFVLGDHRQTSIDSRSIDIGMVRGEQIIGKAFFRVWPFDLIGPLGAGKES